MEKDIETFTKGCNEAAAIFSETFQCLKGHALLSSTPRHPTSEITLWQKQAAYRGRSPAPALGQMDPMDKSFTSSGPKFPDLQTGKTNV